MTPAPLLSLVIVVRNDARGLQRTLQSIELQQTALATLPSEVVIIDGTSSDGSLSIAEAFRNRRTLPTRVIEQPPLGIYPAMNLGWRQARGCWLMYVNAGDRLVQVTPLVEALPEAPSNLWALQGRSAIQPPGLPWAFEVMSEAVLCHQALVYRRELHTRLGPYDERLKVCADTAFMARIPAPYRRYLPALLAISSVSPADASRTPRSIQRDLQYLQATKNQLKPWPTPRLSLTVLRLERWLGVSWSVWIRACLGLLRGTHRWVKVG